MDIGKQARRTRRRCSTCSSASSPSKAASRFPAASQDSIQYLLGFKFEKSDLDYLGQLKGNDGRRLFEAAFLKYLGGLKLRLDVDAIAEGTVVFPQEPLLRVRGPILQAQLVETTLLNLQNFQSLIATKAARVCLAAQGDPVVEFGLRRAQGVDGAMTASRAAYIGGCAGTSNVLAGKVFGIPVKGTHAHSWVMSFDNELDASTRMPTPCQITACSWWTHTTRSQELRHAIEVGKRLRKKGHKLAGIRLDSGDLAYLSVKRAKSSTPPGSRTQSSLPATISMSILSPASNNRAPPLTHGASARCS